MDAKTVPGAARPLTEAQSGLWYVQRLDPLSPALNTGQYLDIRGPLDVALFSRAVAQMAAEAGALALRFAETAEGPRQWIDPARAPVPETVDLSAEPDPEAEALAFMRADSGTPLDPARDRLVRFVLFVLGPGRCLWYQRVHHLAIDGYAMVLITNRVAAIYAALAAGRGTGPSLAPLSRAWDEDARYLTSPGRAADAAWWRARMAGAAVPAATAGPAHTFRRETRQLAPELLDALKARAAEAGVSWPDALTALVGAYCQRFVGGPETVVGVPHMGRMGSPSARVACMKMNVLPLRLAPDEDAPLADFLRAVAADLAGARAHGRYRSEQLRRDLGLVGGTRRLYGPLVNVQPFDLPPRIPGLDIRLHILGAGTVEDITFTFRGDAGAALQFETDTNPDLYSDAGTRAHAERLTAFLTRACGAERLAEVPTASPAEERALARFNATEREVPDTTLTALIEAQMRATPGATALVFGEERMSYAELDRRSAALAARLRGMGAGPGGIVALALDRSLALPLAIVACLRAGAAWLPLDPAHPAARIARILQAAKPVCVLADGAFPADVPVLPRADWPLEGSADGPAVRPDDPAYVIFTSGSTGEPKGVVVEHRAIVNRLIWMREHYGFAAHDRILQKTPATFDVSVWEFILPLICGAAMVVAPPGAHRDPAAIASLIRGHGVSTAHFVPSMLTAFLAAPASEGLRLARVFCSGEELASGLRDRFHGRVTAELHNLYGPTEAAVDVSFWPAGPDDASSPVPIGFPVWNTRLLVLDARMRVLPPGVPGHLWIGGVQLARGYLGRPDLTDAAFVPDPFRPGERLYRTGDLARLREDGAVVYLGRDDHQVKIRGLRIELGEIEAGIVASGLVREVAVVPREGPADEARLIAYVVPAPGYDDSALRRYLAGLVPDYMVPAGFVALDTLPVTAHGKLDRKALPEPAFDRGARPAAPGAEAKVAALFAEVLHLPGPAGAEADFFLMGGDSLSAVRLMLRVEETFGHAPGLGLFFAQPTVAALAAALEAERADHGLGPAILLAAGPQDGAAPLFLIHPAGGLAWGYRALAAELGRDRAVWGLQSPALDPTQPLPESLEALARDYAARVRAIHPQGPWHLAGWSVGGIIAQAMAAHLEAGGHRVGLVALLDAYPAECWRAQPEPDPVTALRALLAVAGHDPEAYPELTTREAITGFLRESGSALGRLPEAALDGVIRAVTDTNRLVRGHHHRRYGGVLTHVRAGLDHQGTGLVPELWAEHAGALDGVPVPFLHPQLTSPAAVAHIAPLLAERLARYDGAR